MAGFSNDIEISIGVSDGTRGPNSIVGTLRRSVWAEFLMVERDDSILVDPIEGVKEWERQAALGDKRVRKYYPHDVKDTMIMDELYDLYEPEGRCDGHGRNL